MADRFFRTKLVDGGPGQGQVPEHVHDMGLEFSGYTIAESPVFVARVYGTTAELDELASRSGVTELTDDKATDLFNNKSDHQIDGVSKPVAPSDLKNNVWVE